MVGAEFTWRSCFAEQQRAERVCAKAAGKIGVARAMDLVEMFFLLHFAAAPACHVKAFARASMEPHGKQAL